MPSLYLHLYVFGITFLEHSVHTSHDIGLGSNCLVIVSLWYNYDTLVYRVLTIPLVIGYTLYGILVSVLQCKISIYVAHHCYKPLMCCLYYLKNNYEVSARVLETICCSLCISSVKTVH